MLVLMLHVSRLGSLVFLWHRCVYGDSCKTSPFRRLPSTFLWTSKQDNKGQERRRDKKEISNGTCCPMGVALPSLANVAETQTVEARLLPGPPFFCSFLFSVHLRGRRSTLDVSCCVILRIAVSGLGQVATRCKFCGKHRF